MMRLLLCWMAVQTIVCQQALSPQQPVAVASGSNYIRARDYCSCEPCIAQKFFILNNLLFFTKNSDIFMQFNIFNISGGGISSTVNSTTFLPKTDFRFQEVASMKKVNQNNTKKFSRLLLWMFAFDIIPEHCKPEINSPKYNSYCSRMKSLRNVIVGRLTNQQLIFVGYRNNKLVPVNDMNLFIEFHALFKHLDEFGYTSSVTYDQVSDRFFTTHYGRINEICVTKSMQPSLNIFALPSMSEIMNADIFHTICYDTEDQYTSILDINGSFYAIKSSGTIDQVSLNSGEGKFEIMQSNADKLFFNCFSNSPILNKLEASSFEFQLAEKAIVARSGINTFPGSNFDYDDAEPKVTKDKKDANNNAKGGNQSWAIFLLITLILSVSMFPLFLFARSKRRINDIRRRFKDAFSKKFPPKSRKNRIKKSVNRKQGSKMTIRTIKRIPKAKKTSLVGSKTSKSCSGGKSSLSQGITSTVIFASKEHQNKNKSDLFTDNRTSTTNFTSLAGDCTLQSYSNNNKDKNDDNHHNNTLIMDEFRIVY